MPASDDAVAHGADAPLVSLALVVIARNESRCIERCLNSAAPYVDRMLVLDTGSQDNTVSLAQACGAEVHHMVWPGSFATARNRALELANARWHLVLDADEWIDRGGETLREAIAGGPQLGTVCVQSTYGAGTSSGVEVDWLTRVLPQGVSYVGAVHEQPASDLPRRRLSLVVGHDGYEPAPMASKVGRNRALLLDMLEQAGNEDAYLLFQLGKDHEAYGELAHAADFYQRCLLAASPMVGGRSALVVRLLHCLGKSGGLKEALAFCGDFLDELAGSPDYFFTVGDLCLDAAVAYPQDALAEWLPMAQSAWERCLAIGEQPEQDGSVAGRGSYLAAYNLSVVCEGLGEVESAKQYRRLSQQMQQPQVVTPCT